MLFLRLRTVQPLPIKRAKAQTHPYAEGMKTDISAFKGPSSHPVLVLKKEENSENATLFLLPSPISHRKQSKVKLENVGRKGDLWVREKNQRLGEEGGSEQQLAPAGRRFEQETQPTMAAFLSRYFIHLTRLLMWVAFLFFSLHSSD